jgi:glycosyltransferase involved in cell wall biosynthesis
LTRVLFLTESFHPVLGGGEAHIRDLGRRLAGSGLATTVVTRRGDAAWPAREELDKIRVVRVSPEGPARTGKYLMVPAALQALRRERSRYDVVVVRGTRVLGLPGLLAARLLGKGVVLQPELNGEMSGEAYTWGKAWSAGIAGRAVRLATAGRNRWLRDADRFVAMSRLIRAEMMAAGVAEERIALIPHGVDLGRFRPASPEERAALRARLGWPAADPVAVYTGRLLRGKGLETLVDAFARLVPHAPNARLVLVGSGEGQALSVEGELKARVEAAGLQGRVAFTGRVDAVEEVLRASDVFVFPSVFEALGISLVEAAACGLPAVASRTGGIVDVVDDGMTGRLVPPGDAPAFAGALGDLLADAATRQAMGQRARTRAVERFDVEDSLERYRALFAEVAARATGARGSAACASR